MSKRSGDGHITGWKAFLLLPVAIPVILLLKFFGIGEFVERSADEVAGFLQDFIEGSGGDWDWDYLSASQSKHPELESIRAAASMVALPISATGMNELKRLLVKAETLAGNSH